MSGKPPATKRLRLATQRRPGAAGPRKRDTIMRALSIQRGPEKNASDIDHGREGDHPPQRPGSRREEGGGGGGEEEDEEDDDEFTQRRVFVNQPLPDDLLDQDGSPRQQFSRNKIRTAKYTPLIFVPKNLWLQFHNIANIYFLFVTILAVRAPPCFVLLLGRLCSWLFFGVLTFSVPLPNHRSSPSSVLPILRWAPCP